MKKILILFSLCLYSFELYAFETVKTDTHIYFISPTTNKLVIIDREKGTETLLATGERPIGLTLSAKDIVVTCSQAGLVSFYNQNTYERHDVQVGVLPLPAVLNSTHAFIANGSETFITLINLETYEFQNIDLGDEPEKIVLTTTHAFVAVNPQGPDDPLGSIVAIDLRTFVITDRIQVCSGPVDMALKDDKLYIVHPNDGVITVVDTIRKIYLKSIVVSESPNRIMMRDKAIVSHSHDIISIVDLATDEVEVFSVKNRPIYSYLYDPHLFVRSFSDREPGWITVINLETHGAFEVQVECMPSSLEGQGDFVFTHNNLSESLSIIDLKERKVIRTVNVNEDKTHIALSDTHLYLDHQPLMPLYPTDDLYLHFKKQKKLADFIPLTALYDLSKSKSLTFVKPWEKPEIKDLELLPTETCLGTVVEYLDLKDVISLILTSKQLARRLGYFTFHDTLTKPLVQLYWRGDTKKANDLARFIGFLGGTLKERLISIK